MTSNYFIISLTAETTVYVGQDSHPTHALGLGETEGGGGGGGERNVCPLVKCDVYILFTDFDHLNTSFSVIIFMRKR